MSVRFRTLHVGLMRHAVFLAPVGLSLMRGAEFLLKLCDYRFVAILESGRRIGCHMHRITNRLPHPRLDLSSQLRCYWKQTAPFSIDVNREFFRYRNNIKHRVYWCNITCVTASKSDYNFVTWKWFLPSVFLHDREMSPRYFDFINVNCIWAKHTFCTYLIYFKFILGA